MLFERVYFRHKNKTAFPNNRGSFFPQVLNLLAERNSAGTIIEMEKNPLSTQKRDGFNRSFKSSQRYFLLLTFQNKDFAFVT